MQCEEISDRLPGIVDGADEADRAVLTHVDGCLRCQAELVQYRRLLKSLHQLRTDVLEPAPGLLADVLAHVERAGERQAIRSLLTGRRAAYGVGIAAAATAAGVGAILLSNRARKSRVAA